MPRKGEAKWYPGLWRIKWYFWFWLEMIETWFVKIQMTLLILIVDDWKLTSLLEQVSATRVAFWTPLTGESWLAKPPVITMVLMMMTMTMMIWFQTTTMLLPERRINFVTAMICSPLESNCVPLPQWERPASPVGHVRPRRAPICGWFVMVRIMMSMIIHGADHGDRDDSPVANISQCPEPISGWFWWGLSSEWLLSWSALVLVTMQWWHQWEKSQIVC